MDTIVSDEERLAWLRLYRSENVGPVTFFRLLARCGSARKALSALPELARKGGGRSYEVAPEAGAQRELAAIVRLGGKLLLSSEADFPAALGPLQTAPLLFVLGNAELLRKPAIAVVGARNASLAGCRLARQFAADLAAGGLVVVSGMARGIDTAVHEGALPGGTVAVLAGGVDVVYPPENQSLYDAIRKEGCVVSEMPPGCRPQAAHFPRRNRLISGLAQGVLVVEATLASGSLITARRGLEQGREIYAVPGSPLDGRAKGPNSLIRQGAVLVESAADILDELPIGRLIPAATSSPPELLAEPAFDDPAARQELLRLLSNTSVTVDEIIRQCQLSPAAASMALLELELAGRLARHPGNKVSLLS